MRDIAERAVRYWRAQTRPTQSGDEGSMAQTDSNGHDSAAFTERMRAMLAESREHVEALAARRVALINEREGELARIKEDYKAKLDKIDGDLAAIRRIERAIDPEAHPKPPVPRANKRDSTHRTNAFTPSEDKRNTVLLALHERDKATVSQLAEAVGVSNTTVKFALDYMRDER